jgi:hypothetical protein
MSGGRFEFGHPGGPGRPAGSRNKATLALDQIADDAGKDILNALVEAAKGGDLRAADLVMQRVWPVRKGRPLSLSLPLPVIKTAADVVTALGVVADLVGRGEVTPDEAAALASVFESKRRAIETVDHGERLAAIEERLK